MGMKLKSGADLCGFELSRFCVQNDVAIPDAPASGRKYFHTGTGMEGKYSLLGRERIFTGAAWRSAAYVDDLANLDLATNADYLALKEKVELLSGEVDTDAIINNMKEVTAFLEGFAEDANLMTVLDGKLDKTGGTISKASNEPLLINNTTAGGGCYLDFLVEGKMKAFVGYSSQDMVFMQLVGGSYLAVKKDGAYYGHNTLLHSGNVGEYAVKIDGSSRMKAEKGLKWDSSEGGNSDNFDSSFFVGRDASAGSTLATSKRPYTAVLNVGGAAVSGYRFQLASYVGPTHNELYYRGYNNNGSEWKDWKTIAFTEFTNAQELQWQDASGNAQNVLFLDGYNDLVLGKATSIAGYRTRIQGNSVELRYGTAQSTGLILNSSGNVTIGAQDLAGTDYKLYVDGAAKALGGLLTTNLAIECDENGVQAGYFSEINHVKGGNLYLQVRQGDLILSHVNGATTIRGTLSVAGYTAINNSLAVSNNIVANGTIACKGVAAEGSAPVGTVDKWAGSIAIGTKTQTYTHGLGTTDITVAIYEKNGSEWVQILTDIDIVNANTIRVTFGSSTTYEHRIVVMG